MKVALFDLDGTLLDTLADLSASVNRALATCGLPPRTQREIRSYLGNGIRVLMEKSVPGGAENPAFGRCFSAFRADYDAHCMDATQPYPGIPALLRALRAAGWRTALVSNKADFAVQPLWRRFFPDTIELAVGQTDALRRKPAPDMPLQALRALGAAPDEAVYIGDSEVDFQTARALGSACVLVSWGFRDRAELLGFGVPVAGSPAELRVLLEKAME